MFDPDSAELRASSLATALAELIAGCTRDPGILLPPIPTSRKRAERVRDGHPHPALSKRKGVPGVDPASASALSRALARLLTATAPVRRGGLLRAPATTLVAEAQAAIAAATV